MGPGEMSLNVVAPGGVHFVYGPCDDGFDVFANQPEAGGHSGGDGPGHGFGAGGAENEGPPGGCALKRGMVHLRFDGPLVGGEVVGGGLNVVHDIHRYEGAQDQGNGLGLGLNQQLEVQHVAYNLVLEDLGVGSELAEEGLEPT